LSNPGYTVSKIFSSYRIDTKSKDNILRLKNLWKQEIDEKNPTPKKGSGKTWIIFPFVCKKISY
jgi:hypothetical protein